MLRLWCDAFHDESDIPPSDEFIEKSCAANDPNGYAAKPGIGVCSATTGVFSVDWFCRLC